MFIERVQIEEGFLDGLDITFSPGLNVIIGARGTGKSSLIELIRFCLAAKNYSEETKRRSYDHAISVLGSGQITVTLKDDDHHIMVSRTVEDSKPDVSARYIKPLIFSQSEVETVGLQASGRLKIVDGFTKEKEKLKPLEDQAIAIIRSLTTDIVSLRNEIDELEEKLSQVPSIQEKLKELGPKEKEVSEISADTQKKSKELETLSKKLATLTVETDKLSRFQEDIGVVESLVEKAISKISVNEPSDPEITETALENIVKKLKPITRNLRQAYEGFDEIGVDIEKLLEKSESERQVLDKRARSLRQSIEELQKGAGAIIREGQKLRERLAQLDALKAVIKKENRSLKELVLKRNEKLDLLEEYRVRKFEERSKFEKRLNKVLGPQIKIDVFQSGHVDNYIASLTDALKGSGLQYKTLVPKIAENISPRELLEYVEDFNVDGLSDIAGINSERATKIIASLNEADLGEIATVEIEDSVSFSLLDGGDYKDFIDLSTGQRCTVILPLILEHTEKIIVIDQPEDHIDNAFITSTLIKAILRRADKGQMILTTHNANIPVLGDADLVVHMASDGTRGFEEVSGSLEDAHVVEAISTVMEGGADAFRRRAEFYKTLDFL